MLSSSALSVMALLTSTSIGVLFYHQAFSSIAVSQQPVGPFNYVYFNTKQRYDTSSDLWEKNGKAMSLLFPKSLAAGVYYDDPNTIADANNSRLSVGFIVDPSEQKEVSEFLLKHSEYKYVELPQTQSVFTRFPYVSQLSFILQVFKVFPKISEFLEEKRISSSCLFEIYRFSSKDKEI